MHDVETRLYVKKYLLEQFVEFEKIFGYIDYLALIASEFIHYMQHLR